MDHRLYQSNTSGISSRSVWQHGSSNFRTITEKYKIKDIFHFEGYNISFRRPIMLSNIILPCDFQTINHPYKEIVFETVREFVELAENEKYRRYERSMVP